MPNYTVHLNHPIFLGENVLFHVSPFTRVGHIPYPYGPYPSSNTGTHTFRRRVLVTLLKTKNIGDSDTDIHTHVLLMLFLPSPYGVRSRRVTRPGNHCFLKALCL